MSLHCLLHDKLPEKKISQLPKGFEVIGDIAIISIPAELEKEKYLIAETLASHRKDVGVVLRKLHKIQGNARSGEFELLLGDRTTTMHRENDCIFYVDVAKTYFSSKLAYERNRIVQKVNKGENILVLFAGAGPFLIPIKKKREVNVTGLDNNPAACAFLRKNLLLNDIEGNIILGDANNVYNLFRKPFDRIIMPAPYGREHFLDLAKFLLKTEGYVHFYAFKKDFELAHFRKLLEERGWRIEFYRNCGTVAPRVARYVFDLQRL